LIKRDYVLLDILFEQPKYQNIFSINVDSVFVEQKGLPVKVRVHCLEDMLGDKLTAFAPNITGIPYEKSGQSQAMVIVNQLCYIGKLFDLVNRAIIKSVHRVEKRAYSPVKCN